MTSTQARELREAWVRAGRPYCRHAAAEEERMDGPFGRGQLSGDVVCVECGIDYAPGATRPSARGRRRAWTAGSVPQA